MLLAESVLLGMEWSTQNREICYILGSMFLVRSHARGDSSRFYLKRGLFYLGEDDEQI